MSIIEHLRRLFRRDDEARRTARADLLPLSAAEERARPAAGTMAVQPLYRPGTAGGGYS
ncbi:hypothetical protein ACH436_07665 [Isoptericola sp. NPDC019693]|uniref:hypothetical protein n=1 Tax=Isoptericola sp. NPDC019693 TaxID=3364009 RepID=UPI0037A7EC0D